MCSVTFLSESYLYRCASSKEKFSHFKISSFFGGHLGFFYLSVFSCIALPLIKIFMVFACAMFYR